MYYCFVFFYCVLFTHHHNIIISMSVCVCVIASRIGVCVCACVHACVHAQREVTGSDSTSGQILLLSLGDGDFRPQKGCPVRWHP